MALGLGYFVDLVPSAIGTGTTPTILQLTAGSVNPFAIHRLELQSNQTGATQTVMAVQMAILSGTGSGGTTTSITPRSVIKKNTVASATTAVYGYTTPGSVSQVLHTWQWNGANPMDIVFGKEITVPMISATQIWALSFIAAPGTPTISCTVEIEEF